MAGYSKMITIPEADWKKLENENTLLKLQIDKARSNVRSLLEENNSLREKLHKK
jgi:PHD/YefM family antitoxin component YafN of YafNO toxin-antitoxin module